MVEAFTVAFRESPEAARKGPSIRRTRRAIAIRAATRDSLIKAAVMFPFGRVMTVCPALLLWRPSTAFPWRYDELMTLIALWTGERPPDWASSGARVARVMDRAVSDQRGCSHGSGA